LVRLALNRLSEKGSWNFDELKLELTELILEDAQSRSPVSLWPRLTRL
jgi:hypothetical protein